MTEAAPAFLPNPGQARGTVLLAGPQRHTLLAGGARSGKTFLLCRALIIRALRGAGSRHVVFRFRQNAVKNSVMFDTVPKVLKTGFPGIRYEMFKGDPLLIRFENGSEIWFCGLDDKNRVEKILGQEFVTLYFNECSQIPYSSVLVARTRLAQVVPGIRQRAYYDMNPSGTGHWTYHEFIEGRDPTSRRPLPDPENYRFAYLNPGDNSANLSPEFLRSLENLPDKQRRRFFEGQYVAEVDGALWTYELIERCRVESATGTNQRICKYFGIERIVVAIDPSGASGEEDRRSDEIGIVVVGKTKDAKAVVLEDRTLRAGPERWAKEAALAFYEWKADTIIAEKNYGGAMVESTIKAVDRDLPVKLISASHGKHVRAEPVSTLYSTGRVQHAGRFSDLEDQLCNFSSSGYTGARSPDRADAMVWGITELLLDGVSSTGMIEFLSKQAEALAVVKPPDFGFTIGAQPVDDELVTMEAPIGVTTISGRSGTHYQIDARRCIAVLPEDVGSLRNAGFREVG